MVCEYQIDPVGIDIENPRLSWKVVSDERNVLQSAYEIRVAETEQALKEEKTWLWNTGKVLSNQTVPQWQKGRRPIIYPWLDEL